MYMQTLFHIDKDKNVILALAMIQPAKNIFPLLKVRQWSVSRTLIYDLHSTYVKKETKQNKTN